MYTRELRHADKILRFQISAAGGGNGWDVREEQCAEVVKHVRYTDWHRVERARMLFVREADALRTAGWVEVA